MDFREAVEFTARALDAAGVAVLVIGILVATWVFAMRSKQADDRESTYRSYRSGIGRAMLLGLEFLVAADIIRTVAIEPTFDNVAVLALIVAVRTFLSITLEVELEGRWPWHRGREAA